MKNKSKKYFKNKDDKRKGLISETSWPGGTPDPEKVSDQARYYNIKAFSKLQNVGSIEVKADPNAEISKGGYPYNILNRTNRVIDANYAGKDNIDGNVLTRLQNSNQSKLLNCFDIITVNFRLNYLYLCYQLDNTTKHNNLAVNVEMTKAMAEALSKGYSTMLTQLPFYTDTITTSMPAITGADNDTYNRLGALLHYQTVLQNAVSPLSKYIQTMSLYQHILDMSYRRESAIIQSLFGLLKKKAFIATLNAIGTSVIGEYFDADWYKQMNTLANIPSRKANDMIDPLMTATRTTYIPNLTMTVRGASTPYYNSSTYLTASGVWLNPDSFTFDGTPESVATLSLEQLVYRLNRLLDVSTILRWARQFNTDPTAVGTINTPSAYYQNIIKYIEAINIILSKFSTSMTDVRTFIDKLDSSGMVYWKKGMKFEITDMSCIEPTYNVILHNTISAYLGGSYQMIFDSNTQRWQCYTLWNKYTGIAEFDRNSGGAFLTFGLRGLDTTGLTNTDIAMCLPIVFAPELTQGSNKCQMVNRLGKTCEITSTISGTIPDPSFSRLDPLNIGFKYKIPHVTLTSTGNASEQAALISSVLALLTTVFGYGEVKLGTNKYSSIDSDYICFLDVQIEDVSNEMIQFCRNYSPFRVMTPDGRRSMGFAKA